MSTQEKILIECKIQTLEEANQVASVEENVAELISNILVCIRKDSIVRNI